MDPDNLVSAPAEPAAPLRQLQPAAEPAAEAKTRLLVLTSSTGSGHDSRAYALRSWVHELYGDKVSVRVEHILERSSRLLRFGVGLYNTIHRYAPFLHNIYWCVVELFGLAQGRKLTCGRRYFEQVLQEYRPHLVFSVHDSTNRGYFETARAVLGKENVRCATYCGEWSGGFGYSRIWISQAADRFFARTAQAHDYAVRHGVPAERCETFCNFLSPPVFGDVIPWAVRPRVRAEHLGLDPEKFTLLLTTGGFGANHHIHFLEALRPFADQVQVIVICGRNGGIYTRLLGWRATHPELTLYLEGYSQRVHRLMQISDAVVTRGGANTTAEALYYQVPIIFTGLGGIMPQERLTIHYFLRQGACGLVRKPADLPALVERWSNFPPEYLETRRRLASLRSTGTPEAFVESLVEMAREAGGGE